MEEYKKRFSKILAQTGALFFEKGLRLKDGRPTPYFVNMGMFNSGRWAKRLGELFSDLIYEIGLIDKIDIVLGPSYKGSALALVTSISLYERYGKECLFEYDRKEEKLHGEGSEDKRYFVNNTFFDSANLFIVDDVITTMKTKYELIDKIRAESQRRKINLNIIGLGIAIDREQTTAVYDSDGNVILNKKGEDPVDSFINDTNIPIYSICGIREVIEYLFREKIPILIDGIRRPMDIKIKEEFDTYMDTYGR